MAAMQPSTVHDTKLARLVSAALRSRCGVDPGDRLLAAVSGGADSVALLHVLHALARQRHWSFDLHAAHIHHGLRAEADEEARFVRRVCDGLGVPCHVRSLDAASFTGNVEAAARRARYEALASVARDIDADAVVTAHHADDQLETLLMRLMRGASLRGMTGIAWRRKLHGVPIVRPMLKADHAMTVDLLERIGQPWREDHTNADIARLRARLRAEVTPLLRAIRPDAAGKAADTASQLQSAATLVERMVQRARRRCVTRRDGDSVLFNRDTARKLPDALLGEMLRTELIGLGAKSDALGCRTIEAIVKAVRSEGGHARRFELTGAVCVVVNQKGIVMSRRAARSVSSRD